MEGEGELYLQDNRTRQSVMVINGDFCHSRFADYRGAE